MINRRRLLATSVAALALSGAGLRAQTLSRVLLLGGQSAAPLDLNFLLGQFDPRISFTRASNAWRIDSTGTLVQMGSNVPRFDYDPLTLALKGLLIEEQRTNSIRNPRFEGATVGVVGSGGVVPSDMFLANTAGLTYEIKSISTVNGLPDWQLHVSGTPNATTNVQVQLEAATQIAAASGQAWSYSQYLRLAGGSFTNISVWQMVIVERSGTGAFLASTVTNMSNPTSAGLATQRFSTTRTLTNASTAYVAPAFNLQVTSGQAVDVTLDIGPPQLEQGGFSTSLILPPAGSPAASTRAADSLTMPLSTFAFNPNAGTIISEQTILQNPSAAVARLVTIDDGTNSNKIGTSINNNGTAQAALVVGGSSTTTPTAGTFPLGVSSKLAFAFQSGDQSLVLNGGASVTKNGSMPSGLTTLRFGRDVGGNIINGYIRHVQIYGLRLPDATLQAKTR